MRLVATSSGGARTAFRALRHRDFALFWTGALISHTGTWMQNVTVPFVLLRATGSPAWVGLGSFAQFLPALLLGPLGGRFADRYPRKRIIVLTQFSGMIVALALWLAWRDGAASPGITVALVAGMGVTIGFGLPAWQSFVPRLVPRDDLLNAVTLNSAQFNASRAIGPTVGGVVLATLGPAPAFLGNAASYGAVLLAMALIRTRSAVVEHPDHMGAGTFREGVRYLRQHRGLVLAVVVISIVVFLGNPVIPLSVVFASDVYEVGPLAYGVLTAALGVGAVSAAVLLGAFGDDRHRSQLAVAGVSVFAAGVLLMGLAPVYAGGLVAMVALGAGYLTLASAFNTSIQAIVAERFRGRVLAVYGMAITGSFPLGALLQGLIADAVGVRWTVAVAGALLVGLAAWLMRRPSLTAALDDSGHPAHVGLGPGGLPTAAAPDVLRPAPDVNAPGPSRRR